MSGIYLHIPFCKQACHYCDFHFATSLKLKDKVLESMMSEIQNRATELENVTIETIYFGGGTPSLLSTDELKKILELIHKYFHIVIQPEITLEANPDDLTTQKVKELRTTEINRLSIGVQSFHDEDLNYMNRIHNSQQADYSIKLSQDKGFENITIDLIYGTPTLSDSQWKENILRAIELKIPHISTYALTVENNTPLFHLIRRKKLDPVDDSKVANQFLLLMETMGQHGFEHYEISNFSKPGFRSKHNTSYWEGKSYIGIGPSAHSYIGKKRRWNISSNVRYIQNIQDNAPYFEEEILTVNNLYNEYIMTGLRRIEGISASYIESNFGSDYKNYFIKELEKVDPSFYIYKNNIAQLTKTGKIMADRIASDLFITQK